MPKLRSKLSTEALEASIEAKDHRLYVYLSDEDYKALKELAAKTGEPMSLTARKAIMYR